MNSPQEPTTEQIVLGLRQMFMDEAADLIEQLSEENEEYKTKLAQCEKGFQRIKSNLEFSLKADDFTDLHYQIVDLVASLTSLQERGGDAPVKDENSPDYSFSFWTKQTPTDEEREK